MFTSYSVFIKSGWEQKGEEIEVDLAISGEMIAVGSSYQLVTVAAIWVGVPGSVTGSPVLKMSGWIGTSLLWQRPSCHCCLVIPKVQTKASASRWQGTRRVHREQFCFSCTVVNNPKMNISKLFSWYALEEHKILRNKQWKNKASSENYSPSLTEI